MTYLVACWVQFNYGCALLRGISGGGRWEQPKSRRELLQSRSIKAAAWKRKVISSKTNRLCNNAHKWIHSRCFVWLENVCSPELFLLKKLLFFWEIRISWLLLLWILMFWTAVDISLFYLPASPNTVLLLGMSSQAESGSHQINPELA